jgi:hypothetical protein
VFCDESWLSLMHAFYEDGVLASLPEYAVTYWGPLLAVTVAVRLKHKTIDGAVAHGLSSPCMRVAEPRYHAAQCCLCLLLHMLLQRQAFARLNRVSVMNLMRGPRLAHMLGV